MTRRRQAARAAGLMIACLAAGPVRGQPLSWERVYEQRVSGDPDLDRIGFGSDGTLYAAGHFDGLWAMPARRGTWDLRCVIFTDCTPNFFALRGLSGQFLLASDVQGLHVSRNGGRNWGRVFEGTGRRDAVSPFFQTSTGILLATMEGDYMVRSEDGGASWHLSPYPASGEAPFVRRVNEFAELPGGTLLAAVSGGLAYSTDGREWHTSTLWRGGQFSYTGQSLAVLPTGNAVAIATGPAGNNVWVSEDGKTWLPQGFVDDPSGTTALPRLFHAAGSSALIAMTIGRGRGHVYRTLDEGRTWTLIGQAPVTADPTRYFAESPVLGFDRRLYVVVTGGPFENPEARGIYRTSTPVLPAPRRPVMMTR